MCFVDFYGEAGQNEVALVPNYLCTLCKDFPTMNKKEFTKHSLDVHGQHIVAFCDLCCKSFKSESGARKHKKMHLGTRAGCPTCHLCGKHFQDSSHLKAHMLSHSDYRAFSCNICGKSYKTEAVLQKHPCYK